MFSFGMNIGKKHHALMKAWARVLNAIWIIIILHVNYNAVTYTAKLNNHTIPNKGSQVTDSPTNFWGLKVQRNRYGKQLQFMQSWKFES